MIIIFFFYLLRNYPRRSRGWRSSCYSAARRWSSTSPSHCGSFSLPFSPAAFTTCCKSSTGKAPDNCNAWTAGINNHCFLNAKTLLYKFQKSINIFEKILHARTKSKGFLSYRNFYCEKYRTKICTFFSTRNYLSFSICLNTWGLSEIVWILIETLERIFNYENIVYSTRGPVAAHFSETLAGLQTLRAFKQEDRFMEEAMKRLDANTNAFLILNTSDRWLSIALVSVTREETSKNDLN